MTGVVRTISPIEENLIMRNFMLLKLIINNY
jgi:hypothetical protein